MGSGQIFLDTAEESRYFTTWLTMKTARDTADALNLTFAALADPTRRAILARLRGGKSSVTEVAASFPLSLPAITKHLKVLERAGLVERSRESRRRPSRLNAAPLRDAWAWMSEYRSIWESRFDRLDQYVNDLMTKESDDD